MESRNTSGTNAVSAFREQVQLLTNENVQLQDRNERLYAQLGELQEKTGQLAGSKTALSSRLIHSEEEKLKISKDLVDFQIESNKMREQYEEECFELRNMILALENRVLEVELHDEKTTGERDALRERLRALEENRKELADEYLVLKSNYLALSKEHEQEVTKNEELSLELLNLANARSFHPRGLNSPETQGQPAEPSAELERVRALVHRLSARKVKPEDVVASEHERRKLEKSLFGNQDHITTEMEKMKEMYSSQQRKLEERMVVMGKELQEAKKAIRNTQHKLAEQSAVVLTSQSQLQEVEAENSRLQTQLKELNEEYRSRLVQYIADLAAYVDNKSVEKAGAGKVPSEAAHMKRFVDSMLKDIRASHRSREEQLAGAARGYKKRLQNLVRTHENLLIAYRMQREQIRLLGSNEMDPGPPEYHLAITDAELLTSTSQELNRLREDKARLEAELHELQMKVKFSENSARTSPPHTLNEESWAELRKQLREFTHTVQEDLEKERSQLLARALVAEEQVAELHEYVDKHLVRYKQEIVRLRKLLGTDGPRALSAGAPNTPPILKPRRNVSNEM
ncbi:coiled-coil domain-containing protein 78 isoform X1 [Sphaerodactylus townsendi]|uniref:coiled-coil domain-containing protein 78 isoform X1 n=1 Tax=Sphaerodactylus townsendi TaxID=933632 RepID=UPI0020274F02|nr:coiled-coil domain-containing protein 78 isoform X1 [Sphaerodactylus townsendi]